MTYQEALQYLYDRLPVFHHIGSNAYKPGLQNTTKLLDALQHPQKNFLTIHVAGTNGKGSVSHYLAAVLQSAGYKTGLYTSPHLVDFGERIRVNGKMIDRDYVVRFTEENSALFDYIQPSFFEATMAMAFQYFSDSEVDIAVVETGLGGRLDSTNIIEPLVSVITNISFDHVGFLGDTLEKIAYEKAGIIKKETPTVIGEWTPETLDVFRKKASEVNSTLYFPEMKISFEEYVNGQMLVRLSDGTKLISGLCGDYQLKNIATALKTIEVLNPVLPIGSKLIQQTHILQGLQHVTELTGLQGRWQQLASEPLVIADTGHNVAGIAYVVEQIKRQQYRKLHMVIGMVNDKDISSVLNLLPKDAVYYFTNAAIPRALPAEDLQKLAANYQLAGFSADSVEAALTKALQNATSDDFIFIGGSNFVVGEAISYFQSVSA